MNIFKKVIIGSASLFILNGIIIGGVHASENANAICQGTSPYEIKRTALDDRFISMYREASGNHMSNDEAILYASWVVLGNSKASAVSYAKKFMTLLPIYGCKRAQEEAMSDVDKGKISNEMKLYDFAMRKGMSPVQSIIFVKKYEHVKLSKISSMGQEGAGEYALENVKKSIMGFNEMCSSFYGYMKFKGASEEEIELFNKKYILLNSMSENIVNLDLSEYDFSSYEVKRKEKIEIDEKLEWGKGYSRYRALKNPEEECKKYADIYLEKRKNGCPELESCKYAEAIMIAKFDKDEAEAYAYASTVYKNNDNLINFYISKFKSKMKETGNKRLSHLYADFSVLGIDDSKFEMYAYMYNLQFSLCGDKRAKIYAALELSMLTKPQISLFIQEYFKYIREDLSNAYTYMATLLKVFNFNEEQINLYLSSFDKGMTIYNDVKLAKMYAALHLKGFNETYIKTFMNEFVGKYKQSNDFSKTLYDTGYINNIRAGTHENMDSLSALGTLSRSIYDILLIDISGAKSVDTVPRRIVFNMDVDCRNLKRNDELSINVMKKVEDATKRYDQALVSGCNEEIAKMYAFYEYEGLGDDIEKVIDELKLKKAQGWNAKKANLFTFLKFKFKLLDDKATEDLVDRCIKYIEDKKYSIEAVCSLCGNVINNRISPLQEEKFLNIFTSRTESDGNFVDLYSVLLTNDVPSQIIREAIDKYWRRVNTECNSSHMDIKNRILNEYLKCDIRKGNDKLLLDIYEMISLECHDKRICDFYAFKAKKKAIEEKLSASEIKLYIRYLLYGLSEREADQCAKFYYANLSFLSCYSYEEASIYIFGMINGYSKEEIIELIDMYRKRDRHYRELNLYFKYLKIKENVKIINDNVYLFLRAVEAGYKENEALIYVEIFRELNNFKLYNPAKIKPFIKESETIFEKYKDRNKAIIYALSRAKGKSESEIEQYFKLYDIKSQQLRNRSYAYLYTKLIINDVTLEKADKYIEAFIQHIRKTNNFSESDMYAKLIARGKSEFQAMKYLSIIKDNKECNDYNSRIILAEWISNGNDPRYSKDCIDVYKRLKFLNPNNKDIYDHAELIVNAKHSADSDEYMKVFNDRLGMGRSRINAHAYAKRITNHGNELFSDMYANEFEKLVIGGLDFERSSKRALMKSQSFVPHLYHIALNFDKGPLMRKAYCHWIKRTRDSNYNHLNDGPEFSEERLIFLSAIYESWNRVFNDPIKARAFANTYLLKLDSLKEVENVMERLILAYSFADCIINGYDATEAEMYSKEYTTRVLSREEPHHAHLCADYIAFSGDRSGAEEYFKRYMELISNADNIKIDENLINLYAFGTEYQINSEYEKNYLKGMCIWNDYFRSKMYADMIARGNSEDKARVAVELYENSKLFDGDIESKLTAMWIAEGNEPCLAKDYAREYMEMSKGCHDAVRLHACAKYKAEKTIGINLETYVNTFITLVRNGETIASASKRVNNEIYEKVHEFLNRAFKEISIPPKKKYKSN